MTPDLLGLVVVTVAAILANVPGLLWLRELRREARKLQAEREAYAAMTRAERIQYLRDHHYL